MRIARWVPVAAVAFGAVEFTNIALEQFVGLPVPWNAIVPASAMGLIVLTASVVAVRSSIVTSVIVIEGGMLIAATAAIVWVALWRRPELPLTVQNAIMHLVALPVVAAIAGAAAIAMSRLVRQRWFVTLAGAPLLAIGVLLLVHAAGLPRPQRPRFVMPGFALAAMGLVMLPCVTARSEA